MPRIVGDGVICGCGAQKKEERMKEKICKQCGRKILPDGAPGDILHHKGKNPSKLLCAACTKKYFAWRER